MKYLPFIDTTRLILRPITLEDTYDYFYMDSQPEVHTYLNGEPMETLDDAINTINSLHLQYEKHGIGRMAVIEKDTFDFVGWTGFRYMEEEINGHQNFLDFGYRFKKEAWRKGYATEAAQACIEFYKKRLTHFDIHAITHIENDASRRVLEKVGFQVMEQFPFKMWNIDCYWYDLKS